MKPEPIKFTIKEGGDWFPWGERRNHKIVFAVLFDDGSIFDVLCGWRPFKYCLTCTSRIG